MPLPFYALLFAAAGPGIRLRALSPGPARFALPVHWRAPAARALVQGRPRGSLRAYPGPVPGWTEFRGFVPAGSFRLVPAPAPAFDPGPRPRCLGAPGAPPPSVRANAVADPVESGAAAGLAWSCRWVAFGRGVWQGILELEAGLERPRPAGVELVFEGSALAPARGSPGNWRREGRRAVLALGAGSLRPGDRLRIVLHTGTGAGDPGLRVRPGSLVWRAFGLAPPPGAPAVPGLGRRLARAIARLLAQAPRSPLERGDHRRRLAGGRSIWTHGEFDLCLGLWRAAGAGVAGAAQGALHAALHLVGRDLARGGPGAPALRLPVVHGPAHGFGRVDPGHVFLEGPFVLAAASADRELLARLERVTDDLATWLAGRTEGPQLPRDLAWPLRALNAALALRARPLWRRARALWLARGAALWDRRRRAFRFPGLSGADGGLRRDLWVEAALLAPALARAAAGGERRAARLLAHWRASLRGLPSTRSGLPAPAYLVSAQGRARPLGAADPWRGLWLADGLATLARWRRRALRAFAEFAARLPGTRPGGAAFRAGLPGDPASLLAFVLGRPIVAPSLAAAQRTKRSPPRIPSRGR